MKKISVFFVSLLLVIVQITLTPHLRFFKLNYGFVFSAIIVVSCIYETKIAVINSLICGIIFDSFVPLNYGTYLSIFLITALLTVFISNFMYKGSLITSVVLALILTILSELVLYYIFIASKGMMYHSFVLTRIILPQAFLNAFVSIIVFGIYKSLYNKLKLNTQW